MNWLNLIERGECHHELSLTHEEGFGLDTGHTVLVTIRPFMS